MLQVNQMYHGQYDPQRGASSQMYASYGTHYINYRWSLAY
jgi:hypothetical protein